MTPLIFLCALLFPTYTFAVKSINDTKRFPVCIDDSDCEKRNLDGHACFQYFCYPWDNKAQVASEPPRPLELCRKDKDCPKMLGGAAKCFRHYERRRVTHGICVPSIGQVSHYRLLFTNSPLGGILKWFVLIVSMCKQTSTNVNKYQLM